MKMVYFIPPQQRRLAMLAAQADTAPVLIYGANGTGKSALAQWIHGNGPRAGRTFLETVKDVPLIEQIPKAQGGTLVVAGIGNFPLAEQMVLLEFFKTRSVPMPGSDGMRMLVNTRIIATTSQALEGRAISGLFNAELLERLNVFRIEMPPLSRRSDEFEDIVLGIAGEIARELHKEFVRNLSPEAWEKLRSYDWPGNIRELRNVLRLSVVAAEGDQIELKDLPLFGHDKLDFRSTREEFEKIYILELLKTFNWEIDRTCKMTRMDKSSLLAKMQRYGISREKLNASQKPGAPL